MVSCFLPQLDRGRPDRKWFGRGPAAVRPRSGRGPVDVIIPFGKNGVMTEIAPREGCVDQ